MMFAEKLKVIDQLSSLPQWGKVARVSVTNEAF